jgi:hypothetical protein
MHSSAQQTSEPQDQPAVVLTSISIPPVGAYWPGQGGKFRGICRGQSGQSDYLLIEHVDELPVGNWQSAIKAAAAIEVDGHNDFSLPNRSESALLYANAKDEHLTDDWYWTSEQHASDPDYAWLQVFSYGFQDFYRKDDYYRARAVRRIPIQ